MTKPIAQSNQFFLTAPSPCPYLPDQMERKVFTQLAGDHAPALNDLLTQGGFRRSQSIAYRPACETCAACISVRVRAGEFTPTRSMKRIARRNRDLVARQSDPHATSEQYSLFRHYLDARHTDGGMTQMTVLDYAQMIEDSHVNSKIVSYFRRGPDSGLTDKGDGDLLACAITDVLADGLSMIYSFYQPDAPDRSLGTFMILDHIARANALGLPYVYLGYWVYGSPKMDYKARFLPQEHLMPQGWVRIDTPPAKPRLPTPSTGISVTKP